MVKMLFILVVLAEHKLPNKKAMLFEVEQCVSKYTNICLKNCNFIRCLRLSLSDPKLYTYFFVSSLRNLHNLFCQKCHQDVLYILC